MKTEDYFAAPLSPGNFSQHQETNKTMRNKNYISSRIHPASPPQQKSKQVGIAEPVYALSPEAESVMKLPTERDQIGPKGELSTPHFDALILALARGQGNFTRSELERLEQWAQEVLNNQIFLDLIFEGLITAQFRANGELAFCAVLPKEPSETQPNEPKKETKDPVLAPVA